MKIFNGKGVFPGIAFGTVFLMKKPDTNIDSSKAADPSEEWEKFLGAKAEADTQLDALVEKTKLEIGESEADIIDVQRLMLEDGDFNEEVEALIKEDGHKAAYAVTITGKKFSEFFASLDDPYMQARSTDVFDVSQRLSGILLGQRVNLHMEKPSIVVADDLTPSETLQMDKSKIRAFVTRRGSTNSHTAILARILNIPSIVQSDVALNDDINGKAMAVDGGAGKAFLEPDDATIDRLSELQNHHRDQAKKLDAVRGLPSITKDGKIVKLFGNIGSVDDMQAALSCDAEGIGLFRSEFLYLGRNDYPGETEQFDAYRKVAEGMAGRLVVIRTLDIGADKQVDYFDLPHEENPALGWRAIRICFDRPKMFKTQLRAIYRASAFGKIAIMFPMITSKWEIERCKEIAAEVRAELSNEGIAIGDVELGIMIETPAAAILAEEFAQEVDFFSVGTNDLTQYTLAIDRQNEKLEPYMDAHHPAILRLLEQVADAAHKAGIWCGICGELAADLTLTEKFLQMGYDELSVSPTFILETRAHIRNLDLGLKK